MDVGVEESEAEPESEPSESEPDSEDEIDPYADESDEESEEERARPRKRGANLMSGYRPSGSVSTAGRSAPLTFSVSQVNSSSVGGGSGSRAAPSGAFSISQASNFAAAGSNSQMSVRQQLMKKMGQGAPRR